MRRTMILASALLFATAGTALASHPGPRDMGRVQGLAHELERAAEHVHRQVERERHHFDRPEELAFRSLHRFADEARHFHRQTERFFQDPIHTERDFRDVVAAYVDAVRRLDTLHGTFHAERDFHLAGRLVVELDRYYGYLGGHGWVHYRGRYGYRGSRDGWRGYDRRGGRADGTYGAPSRGRGHYQSRGRAHEGHGDGRYDRERDDDRGHRSRDRDDDRDDDRRGAWRTRPH